MEVQIEQIVVEPVESVKVKKTADKKAYIREYKRKEYQEKKEEMKEKGRSYYYKYKFNATDEDHIKFGTHLSCVVKLRKELDKLKQEKPEFIADLLKPYL